jgi:hypothetical protein
VIRSRNLFLAFLVLPIALLCGVQQSGATQSSMAASSSPLLGEWVGIYNTGDKPVACRVHLVSDHNTTKGTIQIYGRGSADLNQLQVTDDGFAAAFDFGAAHIELRGLLQGQEIRGSALEHQQHGTLQLIRVLPLDAKRFESFEGIYTVGSRSFLIEHLAGQYITYVEVPTGQIRELYFVGNDEYMMGPSLGAPLPEQRRLKFHEPTNSKEATLTITEHDKTITAIRAPLKREEVEFHNGDVTLKGTLILPSTPGRHPAVVFMHGSGANPRSSFFGLGYLLASKGIAALKYDKRGAGSSTGETMGASYEDFADDAVAGARLLQQRNDIDPNHIGFWGLSEGAWTAPLAAVKFGNAAFVAGLSGIEISPEQEEIRKVKYQLKNDGRFSDADITDALAFLTARNRYLRSREGWDDYAALLKTASTKPWWHYGTTDLYGFGPKDSMHWDHIASYYFYDPLATLRKLHTPFLNVLPQTDNELGGLDEIFDRERAALKEAGNKDFVIRVLPHATHNLFETDNDRVEDLTAVQRFVPEVFTEIVPWMIQHAQVIPSTSSKTTAQHKTLRPTTRGEKD